MSNKADLSSYDNSWYKPGAGFITRALWYFISLIYVKSYFPFSGIKIFWLRLFGAQIGRGVVIKPGVHIKYPWKLKIGDHSWIGEGVWIDNLGSVDIGGHCCVSQGALIICGNHNYKKSSFELMVGDIKLEDGVWIGSRSMVCGGVNCESHAVLLSGSVASTDLEPYSIYRGNPAVKIKSREINS